MVILLVTKLNPNYDAKAPHKRGTWQAMLCSESHWFKHHVSSLSQRYINSLLHFKQVAYQRIQQSRHNVCHWAQSWRQSEDKGAALSRSVVPSDKPQQSLAIPTAVNSSTQSIAHLAPRAPVMIVPASAISPPTESATVSNRLCVNANGHRAILYMFTSIITNITVNINVNSK